MQRLTIVIVHSLLIYFFFPLLSYGTNYFVNSKGSVPAATNIQAAVELAQPGDTIIVEPGLYQEHIIIKDKRNLILKPIFNSDKKLIEVRGGGKGNGIVEIVNSHGITINGFKITGDQDSPKHIIYIISSSVVIENNSITKGRATGIYVAGKSNAELIQNRIHNNYTGVLFYESIGKAQFNKIYKNSKRGIHISNHSKISVKHNTFYQNKGSAVLIEWGSVADVFDNIIVSNGIGIKSSIRIPANYNLYHKNHKNFSGLVKSSHDIFNDPIFQDSEKADFSLKPGSPALHAGSDGLDMGGAF